MTTPTHHPDELLMAQDVARMADVSADTVRAWADKGVLPVAKTPSGVRFFRRRDVDAFLAKRRAEATP
jgi:excisionase family DNA binding protein